MKFYLKQAGRSQYYQGHGRWGQDLGQALEFGSASTAIAAVRAEGLNQVELLFHSGDAEEDFVMRCPTQHKKNIVAAG